jgi:hypothetical protein
MIFKLAGAGFTVTETCQPECSTGIQVASDFTGTRVTSHGLGGPGTDRCH